MPKASPLKDAFNAGEMSPLMAARIRIDKYANALKTCENMIPMVQGGVTRRTGTMFVEEVKQSDNYVASGYVASGYVAVASGSAKLVPFEFSVTQTYVLEFGSQYIRFYKDRGQIQTSGVAAWLTATAYVVGDLRTEAGRRPRPKISVRIIIDRQRVLSQTLHDLLDYGSSEPAGIPPGLIRAFEPERSGQNDVLKVRNQVIDAEQLVRDPITVTVKSGTLPAPVTGLAIWTSHGPAGTSHAPRCA